MSDIYYSIIIPHKNIPQLLHRCLDSIPQQNNVEIIIVDDNSDSDVVDFSKFPGYDRKDVSIIFDKSNKGPGAARNLGIKQSKGRWIIFVDADDFFNYCIGEVWKQYKDDDSDVVYFAASSIDSETYNNTSRADYIVDLIYNYVKGNDHDGLMLKYYLASPCGKFIKREVLVDNGIFFPEDVIVCEDVKFSYLLGKYAKKFKVDTRALCCYTSRNNSRSLTIDDRKLETIVDVYAERNRFLKDNGIPLDLNQNYIEPLAEMFEENKEELYRRCLTIVANYGFPKEQVETQVRNFLSKKKRRILIDKIKKLIGIIRCKLAIRSRFRMMLHFIHKGEFSK